MANGKSITTDDTRIREALEELIPLINEWLQKAAGRPVSFLLLAGIQGELGVAAHRDAHERECSLDRVRIDAG
jgi:hypothetical protein